MPSEFGGDQCGKDYAPHMWIGDHFIGGTGKNITVGDWEYRVGHVDDETMVAERCAVDANYLSGPRLYEAVDFDDIPDEVKKAISPTAHADRKKKVEGLGKIFNPE